MKKLLILVLVLAMVLSVAACGSKKQPEVVENVDPNNNNIVIETPPAVVSGTDNTEYPPATALPTTAPTTAPSLVPTATPEPTATPAPETPEDDEEEFEYADDTGLDYNATYTQAERNNAKTWYTDVEWANFRVGPGTEYKIYESLPIGSDVLVLGYTSNGWAKILYNDYLGFIWAEFITEVPPKS